MMATQVWLFLNEINDKDDEDEVMLEIMSFSDKVPMELAKRWDELDEPPEDWDDFEQLWLDTYFDWIKEGNGILLMWSKDSDNVFPYIWWYIGYNKKAKRFESSAWMIAGDFLDISTNVMKINYVHNWNGITLNKLDEERCAQMLSFSEDLGSEMREGIAVEWANCTTGLNVWKTTTSLEEIMRKTLNWSNANLEFILR